MIKSSLLTRPNFKDLFLLLVALILSFLLLSYKITDVPPGINGDEAGIGYNSLLISRTLTDENDNFLPLFIFAKSSDWKQPVTVYATAFLFRVFGVSYFTLRATSVVFVGISLLLLFFISKFFGGLKFFLLASLLLITTPIIMIQSHLALENIAILPFILFWLLMLLAEKRTPKYLHLVLAGTSLGVGMFSYLGMRLVVPVLAILTLIFFGKLGDEVRWNLGLCKIC